MSAQSKVIFQAVVKVALESGLLQKEIKKIETKLIDKGLELLLEAGIDTTLLPIDVRAVLRGERPTINPNKLLAPPVICAMPQLTSQQKETATRIINNAKEEVERIYTTTNAIKEQVITLTLPIMKLQLAAEGIATTVEAVSNLLEVLKKLAIPTASPPGVGVPTGVLNTFSSTIGSLSDLVKAAAVDIRVIPNALGIMSATINAVIAALSGLSLILDPFLKVLTMVKSVVDLQDQCPLLDQSDIDNIQNQLLSDIVGNLAQVDPLSGIGGDLERRLQLNSDNPYFYKNFRFILEDDPLNPYFFPSRRIRCFRQNSVGFSSNQSNGGNVTIYNINELTNPSLPAESYSYASSLVVLVAEGRFAVDTYTDDIKLFSAPVFRENVELISDSYVNITDLNLEELQEYADRLGFDSVDELVASEYFEMQNLPNYIIYGGTRVNMNSSPTDVEYGADALVNDGSYSGGTGITRSSYIQSGVIQVNKPIIIRMRTFGGTGNPIPNNTGVLIPRYTQTLLTIKRSSAIQDDINPFTGRIEGFTDNDAVNQFVADYGQSSLKILENINTTAQETGTGLFFGGGGAANSDDDAYTANADFTALNYTSTFVEQLKWVFDNWYAQGENEGEGRDRGDNVRRVIDILFSKSQQLLYNEDVLYLSKRLFGNIESKVANFRTRKFKEYTLSPFYGDLVEYENWYWTARLNSSSEELDRTAGGRGNAKAATLGMLYYGLRQFTAKFTELYGDRTEYNNGAWISPASGLPLIPGNVGPDNNDITITLQPTQTAQEGQEINEIVGGLEILGTYTYDLEIIDSMPAIGGAESNYPTNYTELVVVGMQE